MEHTGLSSFKMWAYNCLTSSLLLAMEVFPFSETSEHKINSSASGLTTFSTLLSSQLFTDNEILIIRSLFWMWNKLESWKIKVKSKKRYNQVKGSRNYFHNDSKTEAEPKLHWEWNSKLPFWCLLIQLKWCVCLCIYVTLFWYTSERNLEVGLPTSLRFSVSSVEKYFSLVWIFWSFSTIFLPQETQITTDT